MSIHFVTGKPGGGKSYYAVMQICNELLHGNRYVVTNIALNLPEIAAWIQKQQPAFESGDALVDITEADVYNPQLLSDRIRILDDSESAQFWLHEPGRDFLNRRSVKSRDGEKTVPDFEDRAKRGTLYVIDEVHCYFGSREWQGTGADAMHFLSQHRKLRCDCIFVTQHPEQVDKAFRRLAQEYVTMRNLSREPIYGFRVGSLFRWARSLNPPTAPNARVFESGFLKLNCAEFGKFYDTMAGVGITGRVLASEEKRGRSMWWLAIPIVLLIILVAKGPAWAAGFGSWTMKRLVSKVTDSTVTTNKSVYHLSTGPTTSMAVAAPVASPEPTRAMAASVSAPVVADDVHMTGCVQVNGTWRVLLSDGRIAGPDEGLQALSPSHSWCMVDGVKYVMRTKPVEKAAPSPALATAVNRVERGSFVHPQSNDMPDSRARMHPVRVHDNF